MYSEGISGVLIEQGNGWYYKSNLGAGEFSHAALVSPKPSFTGINNGALSIQELEGNGKILVQPGRNGGYFELNECEGWQPMQTF
ncbi:MAG: hypothetical protein IPJ13_24080 [Saprospiraceae bacterium]|nr:hypothetical protein [Saprospiraceae bacterium]